MVLIYCIRVLGKLLKSALDLPLVDTSIRPHPFGGQCPGLKIKQADKSRSIGISRRDTGDDTGICIFGVAGVNTSVADLHDC